MENGQDLLHAIRLPSLYIMSHIFCSSFTSPLPLSSPGAASVHLLISFCAGKPPVQGRQEDQEMASGTQIRHKKKKNRHRFVEPGCLLFLSCFAFLSVVFCACRCSLTLQSIATVLDGVGCYIKAFPNSTFLV